MVTFLSFQNNSCFLFVIIISCHFPGQECNICNQFKRNKTTAVPQFIHSELNFKICKYAHSFFQLLIRFNNKNNYDIAISPIKIPYLFSFPFKPLFCFYVWIHMLLHNYWIWKCWAKQYFFMFASRVYGLMLMLMILKAL